MAANRPPERRKLPRQLEWPEMSRYQMYLGGQGGEQDFAMWWVGYAELTQHVANDLRPLHLMTAVHSKIKDNCEAHFQSLGRPMGTVSLEELKAYIIATYQPVDAVYKRILSYIALMQKGMATENYVRLRQQTLNALHSDGLIIPAGRPRTSTLRERLASLGRLRTSAL